MFWQLNALDCNFLIFFHIYFWKKGLILKFENNVGKVVLDGSTIYVSMMWYRYEVVVFDSIFLKILYLKYVVELEGLDTVI